MLSTRITFGRGHELSSFFSFPPLLSFLFLSAFSFTSSSFSRTCKESFRNRSKKLLLLLFVVVVVVEASISSLLGGGGKRAAARDSFSIDAFDSQIQSEMMKCDSCEERKEIRNVFISSLHSPFDEYIITRNNARGCHDDDCCFVLRLRESVDGEEEQKREY